MEHLFPAIVSGNAQDQSTQFSQATHPANTGITRICFFVDVI
jgi:hypothetical protein